MNEDTATHCTANTNTTQIHLIHVLHVLQQKPLHLNISTEWIQTQKRMATKDIKGTEATREKQGLSVLVIVESVLSATAVQCLW